MYTVFSIFKESLFALNQADAYLRFSLTWLYKVGKLCDEQNKFESSAKRIGRHLVREDGKSLMYMINKSGPKMEPCGTPCVRIH